MASENAWADVRRRGGRLLEGIAGPGDDCGEEVQVVPLHGQETEPVEEQRFGKGTPDPWPVSVRADERLNRRLSSIRDSDQLPGLIGAIVRGEARRPSARPASASWAPARRWRFTDQVHLGSCTKAMTATLIGKLVDEGLLSWSSTIRSVFPELASQIHPDFQAATLSHLLTHRAGLPHDASWWRLPGRTTTEKRRAALWT